MATLDVHRVVLDEPGLPLHGLTVEKARIINDAFAGLRVLIVGGEARMWTKREVWMFLGIALPGDYCDSSLTAAFDVRLMSYSLDTRVASPGTTRTISPDYIERMTVVDPHELSPCWSCGCWYEQSALRDSGRTIYYEEPDQYESRLECVECFNE